MRNDFRELQDELGKPVNVQFVFFYAGHGVLKDAGTRSTGFLALSGFDAEHINRTGFEMSDVKMFSKKVGAKQQLYLMDCCHAGQMFEACRGENDTLYSKLVASQPSVYGISAVDGAQESIEQGGHGIFTKCLGLALDGAAMRPGEEVLTHTDIAAYLAPLVTEKSEGQMVSRG